MKITVSLKCTKPFCWGGVDKKPGDVVDNVPQEDIGTYAEWFEVVAGSQSSETAGPAPVTPTPPAAQPRATRALLTEKPTEGEIE